MCHNRCECYKGSKCCCRKCYREVCYENRCDDFLLPILFYLLRDRNRCCRYNFVDRYDRYRW